MAGAAWGGRVQTLRVRNRMFRIHASLTPLGPAHPLSQTTQRPPLTRRWGKLRHREGLCWPPFDWIGRGTGGRTSRSPKGLTLQTAGGGGF